MRRLQDLGAAAVAHTTTATVHLDKPDSADPPDYNSIVLETTFHPTYTSQTRQNHQHQPPAFFSLSGGDGGRASFRDQQDGYQLGGYGARSRGSAGDLETGLESVLYAEPRDSLRPPDYVFSDPLLRLGGGGWDTARDTSLLELGKYKSLVMI